MRIRYAHLDPGHLAEYADRTLLDARCGSSQKIRQTRGGEEEEEAMKKNLGRDGQYFSEIRALKDLST